MPLVNKTVTGLVNGVSRQPFQLRLDSQGQEMINCVADIAKGVRRRKGIEYLYRFTPSDATVQGNGNAHIFHFINRDRDNQFLVHLSGGATTPLEIYDLSDGTKHTVTLGTGAATFLSTIPSGLGAIDTFRLLTVADTTWIVNNSLTPAMKADLSDNPDSWAIVTFKAGVNGIDYRVNLRGHTENVRRTATVPAAATGAIETSALATSMAAAINALAATPDIVAEAVDNAVLVKVTDDTDFDISVSDDFGDTAMSVVKVKGKVQAFSELPPLAAGGMIVEVQGDPDVEGDNFFVQFENSASGTAKQTSATFGGSVRNYGEGVWAETIKWNTPTTIEEDSMPFQMVWDGSTTWNVDPITWGQRAVGDTDTAPDPSFIGEAIEDVVFHKNRLGLVAGESIVFSGVDDFEAFFPTTVVTLADDDVIDVTANFSKVARLKFAISFFDSVIVFADSGVFAVRGSPDAFTQTTVEIQKIADIDGRLAAKPVAAGERIFFATLLVTTGAETLNRAVRFFELVRASDTDAFQVDPINEHVLDYIPDQDGRSTPWMAADGGEQMLIWQPNIENNESNMADTNQFFLYQWFSSNREKVQSAWHRWFFDYFEDDFGIDTANGLSAAAKQAVYRAEFVNGFVYVISAYQQGTGLTPDNFRDVWVGRIPLASQNAETLAFETGGGGGGTVYDQPRTKEPFFDFWQQNIAHSVAYDGTRTWYDVEGIWMDYTQNNNQGVRTNPVTQIPIANLIMIPESQGSKGIPQAVTALELDSTSFPRVTRIGVDGDFSTLSVRMTFGVQSRSQYTFSPPFVKDSQGKPILGGRTLVRRAKVRFAKDVDVSSFAHPETFIIEDSAAFSNVQTHTGKRLVEKPIHKENDQVMVGVYSVDPDDDFELIGIEWGLDFSNNARNI